MSSNFDDIPSDLICDSLDKHGMRAVIAFPPKRDDEHIESVEAYRAAVHRIRRLEKELAELLEFERQIVRAAGACTKPLIGSGWAHVQAMIGMQACKLLVRERAASDRKYAGR